MHICIEMLLDEFREFVKLNNPKGKTEEENNNQHTKSNENIQP
ncbi:hypothetical protein [Candidatus Tisiphia endosymbiont of Nedyus quadrimaculatus]